MSQFYIRRKILPKDALVSTAAEMSLWNSFCRKWILEEVDRRRDNNDDRAFSSITSHDIVSISRSLTISTSGKSTTCFGGVDDGGNSV